MWPPLGSDLLAFLDVLRTLTLIEEERRSLNSALAGVESTPYGAHFCSYHNELCQRHSLVPEKLLNVLSDYREARGSAGALLIRHVLSEINIAPTPTVPFVGMASEVVGTEALLVLLAGTVAMPIGFSDWHGGDRVQNLYPIPEMSRKQCASNAVYLEMHTETAFRPRTPTHIVLLCLRNLDLNAETVLCDLRGVIDELPPEARELLSMKCFRFRDRDGRFGPAYAIDIEQDGVRRLHFAEAINGSDDSSRAVLSELKARIADSSITLCLQPGDLLFIDNRHMIHGRLPLTPKYDGTDRWLQRVLLDDVGSSTLRRASRARVCGDNYLT